MMNVQQKIMTGVKVSVGVAIGCVLATRIYKAGKTFYLKRVGRDEENLIEEVVFEEESL